jgi:hypothetical protein
MKPQPAMLWNVGIGESQIVYHDARMDGMTLATPVYKTQAEGLETLEILRTTNLEYILQSQEVH